MQWQTLIRPLALMAYPKCILEVAKGGGLDRRGRRRWWREMWSDKDDEVGRRGEWRCKCSYRGDGVPMEGKGINHYVEIYQHCRGE